MQNKNFKRYTPKSFNAAPEPPRFEQDTRHEDGWAEGYACGLEAVSAPSPSAFALAHVARWKTELTEVRAHLDRQEAAFAQKLEESVRSVVNALFPVLEEKLFKAHWSVTGAQDLARCLQRPLNVFVHPDLLETVRAWTENDREINVLTDDTLSRSGWRFEWDALGFERVQRRILNHLLNNLEELP